MKNSTRIRVLSENDELILENVLLADRFFFRLKGLMGKDNLEDDEGLLIRPCNSIHTFFMKFNLDVAFIDKSFEILEIYRDFAPNKLSKIYKDSKFVLEARAGSFSRINIGDRLRIVIKD